MEKGFFFALAIFLLLSYILVSISSWTASVQITEQRIGDQLGLKNAKNVLEQVRPDAVEHVVQLIAYGSLSDLNQHAQQHPVQAGREVRGPSEEFFYVNRTLYQLMVNGQADSDNFADGVSLVRSGDSLSGWRDQLNSSLGEIGYRLNQFDVLDFNTTQRNERSVYYNFTLLLGVESRDHRVQANKTYVLGGDVSIEGLTDPAIYRKGQSRSSELRIAKQFFFAPDYPEPASTRPHPLPFAGIGGEGWFYGKIVRTEDAAQIDQLERPNYILMGSYDDILHVTGSGVRYTDFGAYLLTSPAEPAASSDCPGRSNEENTLNPIRSTAPDCTEHLAGEQDESFTPNPFVIAPDFDISRVGTPAPDLEGTDQSRPAVLFIASYNYEELQRLEGSALVDAKYQPVRIYNIENLRDFTSCGYYTHNPVAPSYLQRLLEGNPFSDRRSDLGIETTLVGSFIGGEGASLPSPQYYPDSRSRLDRELFNGTDGVPIRGMAGCKNLEMCNADSPIGHFRMGADATRDYLGSTDGIQCGDGRASCET